MKKAFTLIELLIGIIVLGIVLSITIPTVNYIINSSRQRVYDVMIKEILKGAKQYLMQYKKEIENLEEEGVGFVTINEMISKGILDVNITNFLTKESFSTAGVKITKCHSITMIMNSF